MSGLGKAVPLLGQAPLIGDLFKVPAPLVSTQKPPVMPVPDDAALKASQRRQAALQRRKGGRASTILTALGDETLG